MTEKTFLTFDKRDEFNRKPIAKKIITLLESDIDVSPLLIDGDWGTGKSEFCQKLINLMDKEKYHLVYVDAFKTDYMEEPLLALLAEIIKTCTLGEKTEKQVERQKELIKALASAAKFGVKTVLKAGVNFLLKQNVEELSEEWKGAVEEPIKELAEKTIEATTEALLKEQVEAERNIKALQDCLKGIAKDKPIIIFIDELDRCRPDYAIDMLEIIKHVFEIDKIKIVLVANMKVIRLAVDHRYGHGVNSYSYLDKFIKFRITLPNSSKSIVEFSDDKNNSFTYLEHLVSNSSLLKGEYHNDLTKGNNTNYLLNRELILSLVTRNNVSLRDVEKIIRNFEIYTAINKEEKRSPLMAVLYTFSVFLFAINPEMLFGLSKGNADIESVANVVGDLSSGYFCINSKCQGVLIIISEMFCNSRKISYISEMGRYKRYNYKKENFIENALANYPSCDIKKDMELRYSLSDYFNENNDITIKSNHCNLFKKVFEDLSLFQIMD
jgi:KAP P-loop domain protein